MFYKCSECSKIIDGYTKKCPECGNKIEMTDSVSEAEVKNFGNAEENEEKFELFKKRIKYGYIVMAIYLIVSITLLFFIGIKLDVSTELLEALTPVLIAVVVIILVIIIKKCHFFACPHCDHMMRKYNYFYHSMYCPYCGKRIRK